MTQLIDGKQYGQYHAQRRAVFEERINSFARCTAGRIDALVLKIPALLFVEALQSAKILLKATLCVLTFNQCKHINKFFSFSGVENDVAYLAAHFVNLGFAVKDVILAPHANYVPSGAALFKGLRNVFSGGYHKVYEGYKGDSKITDSVKVAIGVQRLAARDLIKFE